MSLKVQVRIFKVAKLNGKSSVESRAASLTSANLPCRCNTYIACSLFHSSFITLTTLLTLFTQLSDTMLRTPITRATRSSLASSIAASRTLATSKGAETSEKPSKDDNSLQSKAQEAQSTKKSTKTVADSDMELIRKLAGISGEGGEAGIEYEDGKPVAMKRGVRNNMFRLILMTLSLVMVTGQRESMYSISELTHKVIFFSLSSSCKS